jgi:vancomycin resistance protein YoaR
MKKYLFGLFATTAAIVAASSMVAAKKLPTIRANTYVGAIPLGGLAKDEAARQIRIWWETEKREKLHFHLANGLKTLEPLTPSSLGITVDDKATVELLPVSDLSGELGAAVHIEPDKLIINPVFKSRSADFNKFESEVRAAEPARKPARVVYSKGEILKTREEDSMSIDWPKLLPAVAEAIDRKTDVEIPEKMGDKRVSDSDLDQITDVISQYSTHFPSSNRPRCSNIKLASAKLNGVVLLPGERLSFNGTVGRRTIKAGFQLAGVYKNGKHDVGIGGGICQVSTTLYNASLFADLRIRQRSNHSLPVAYVPLGRDATVDYGSLDLVIQNSSSTPIAVTSHYVPGRLTFTILGKKDPGLKVKVEQGEIKTWDPDVSTEIDRSLKPGARRILQPGSEGHAVSSFRLIYRDGKLLRREELGRNTYGGQTRIVAVNPMPKAPKVAPLGPTLRPTLGASTPNPATSPKSSSL